MKRSAAVPAAAIVATAVGLGVVVGYHPSGGGATASLPASVKVGTTAGVGAGTSAVGTDQPLAGGLGDIQVRVSAQNGKITSVGLAKLNVHGPQSSQITGSVVPQLIQQTMATNGGPIHAVSGATYTSQAYAASLQAALDKIAATGGTNAALGTGNGHGSVVVPGGEGGHDD
ncbi:MAG: FMN-binding protein [Thermoleophilia bacterium]